MKKTIGSLIIFLLFPTLVWSQNQEKDKKIWNRFAIGMGYDVRGANLRAIDDRLKPFDFKFRYELSDHHSFYFNIPFYTKKFNIDTSSHWKLDQKTTGRGFGVGYNYNIINYWGFKLFAGIGFDYYKWKIIVYSSAISEENTGEYILDLTVTAQETMFALAPQIGLAYRWKFLEGRLEYKNDFALSKYVDKWYGEPNPELDPDYGPIPQSIYPGKNKFRSFDGLNLGLFIHF